MIKKKKIFNIFPILLFQFFWITLLGILIIDSHWNLSLAQSESNSGLGRVINPNPNQHSEFVVNVRKDSPKITLFGYKLGENICAVKSGTQFRYSKVIQTINNQIWYQVDIDNPIEANKDSCPQRLQGWLIAQQSDGTRLVKEIQDYFVAEQYDLEIAGISEDESWESEEFEPEPIEPNTTIQPTPKISLPQYESNSEVPYVDISPEQRKTEADSITINRSEWKIFSKYLLVSLGSILGLLVVTFEQAGSDNELSSDEIFTAFTKKIVSSIFLVRLIILIVSSFAFISLLGGIEEKDNLLKTIQTLSTQGSYEPIIAGFLICLVILNFTSSNK
ncbi:MAG: hypothetical protein AAGE84_01800 [Cyanobacteria bacterium P01_G01_bin.39]